MKNKRICKFCLRNRKSLEPFRVFVGRNLQQAMEDQVETCNELKNLMERKDHQHALEINEMDKQLQEVNKRENMLSEQLDIHQTNFDALRSELSEVFSILHHGDLNTNQIQNCH